MSLVRLFRELTGLTPSTCKSWQQFSDMDADAEQEKQISLRRSVRSLLARANDHRVSDDRAMTSLEKAQHLIGDMTNDLMAIRFLDSLLTIFHERFDGVCVIEGREEHEEWEVDPESMEQILAGVTGHRGQIEVLLQLRRQGIQFQCDVRLIEERLLSLFPQMRNSVG